MRENLECNIEGNLSKQARFIAGMQNNELATPL